MESLSRFGRGLPREDFRMDDLRQDFQTIDETRAGAVEIGAAIDGKDVSLVNRR